MRMPSPGFVIGAILALLIFAGTFPAQFPFDNQSTYLLNGLASSGSGHLSEDWFSNTSTPFVVFAAIVGALNQIGFLGGIHVLELALILVFSMSCMVIAGHSRADVPLDRSAKGLIALILLTVVLHRESMVQGLADQSVLGWYLQPSEFGVLLILSVALFVARRPISPYMTAAAAGVLHQSYLWPGAVLVLGFLAYDAVVDRKIKEPVMGAVLALAVVAPILWYSAANFAATDPEAFDQSRRILAELRIPHHARPEHWFDRVQALKLGFIVLAILLSTYVNRRLTYVMAVAAGVGAVGSVAVIFADSNALYLLFPWRISAVLMPLATCVMAIGIVRILVDSPLAKLIAGRSGQAAIAILAVSMAGLAVSARIDATVARSLGDTASAEQDHESEYLDLIRAVRRTMGPGQIYLHNPERFESFRIRTGLPVYVDFKSHPYRDEEVMEWWARLAWATAVFHGGQACDPSLAEQMRDRHITHVIIDKAMGDLDAESMARCLGRDGVPATRVYDNPGYGIIRLP